MAKIIRKIKKVSQKVKKVTVTAGKVLKKAVTVTKKKKPAAAKTKRAISPRQLPGISAEQAKYFTHPEVALKEAKRPAFQLESSQLPQKYDRDTLVLMVRDPWWLYSYWEVRDSTYQKFKNELGRFFDTAKKTLRVYDVSYINFNGSNAHRHFDIDIAHNANSWYIDTAAPGRSWCVDLGLKLSDGRFITILRSNIVTTPLDGPSWITDEEWMVPDDLFVKLYSSAVGLGSSPGKVKKPWLELQRRLAASGGLFSAGFSPVKKKEESKRKFWLVVNTELIVYGATEPDAKVSVMGTPITLRPDGTFSLRFSLPDGKQIIPVKGKSSDGIDEITITPVVTKETR